MNTKDIVSKIEELIKPFANQNQYELVEVEFVKEGQNHFLRIFLDKEGGFSISDCEKTSRFIEEKLDTDDFIQKAYILEVSSPGIDRVLKKDFEFQKYKGRLVDLSLYKPINNSKKFQGELVGLVDNKIVLNILGDEVEFDRKDVATCRLSVIF